VDFLVCGRLLTSICLANRACIRTPALPLRYASGTVVAGGARECRREKRPSRNDNIRLVKYFSPSLRKLSLSIFLQ
jgi:hypothetical protein